VQPATLASSAGWWLERRHKWSSHERSMTPAVERTPRGWNGAQAQRSAPACSTCLPMTSNKSSSDATRRSEEPKNVVAAVPNCPPARTMIPSSAKVRIRASSSSAGFKSGWLAGWHHASDTEPQQSQDPTTRTHARTNLPHAKLSSNRFLRVICLSGINSPNCGRQRTPWPKVSPLDSMGVSSAIFGEGENGGVVRAPPLARSLALAEFPAKVLAHFPLERSQGGPGARWSVVQFGMK